MSEKEEAANINEKLDSNDRPVTVVESDSDSDSEAEKNSVHSSDDGEDTLDTGAGAQGDSEDLEAVRELLAQRLRIGPQHGHDDDQKLPAVLESLDLDGIVKYIKDGRAKHVITMAGAGISTSAGIPDFRTPGTGLYDNLQKYDLPNPMAIFDIGFFRENPAPFFLLAKELYPHKFTPTTSHYFVRLLQEKGLLLRHYTQNIDTLERVAGISDSNLVEAHGAFHTGHCINCTKEYSEEWIRERILTEGDKVEIPVCSSCGGTVKPDIVFFGENLPERFFRCAGPDFSKCDLLIILGTSLVVQPFASLVDRVGPLCPRLLINMEEVGVSSRLDLLLSGGGLQLNRPNNYRDVALLGDCDKGCLHLAEALGWKKDLENLIEKEAKSREGSKGKGGGK